jgi:hypothetical protein
MADIYGVECRLGSSNTPAISNAATALAANSQRGAFMIQNLGTNPLFVLLGTGATSSVFHVVLKAGTGNDDGSGGSFAMEGVAMYTGIVTVAGTSPRYTVAELTA